MTIPIYSDKNISGGNLNSTLKNRASPAISKATGVNDVQKVTEGLKQPNNSIQISHEAKVLNDYIKSTPTEEIDWEKVNKIKAQVESGSYSINYQQLADKIIDFENKII